MKKLIALMLSIFTILLVSTSAFAATVIVDWGIVTTVHNIEFNSKAVVIARCNTTTPTPDMTYSGTSLTQKTTYNTLLALYESLTVGDVTISDSTYEDGQFEWYKYGSYYWIKYNVDRDIRGYYIGNYQGKILYCDAPASETTYTFAAIAGATGYCLTDRPAGTSGNGYLGDLCVSQDNLTTIHGLVSNLGGAADYYTVLRIIDGEYRYYIMCTYPNRTQYFVCNTSGQLYYALKDEPDNGGSGSGSSFDATEVITAINSVYDAVDIGFYSVCRWLDAIQDNISSFNTDVLIMSQNMTNGFVDLRNVGNTINTTLSTINSSLLYTGDNITSSLDTFRTRFEDYFESLGKSYPVLTTVKLSGNDNLFMWSADDIITDFSVSNATDIGNFVVYRGFHYNDAYGPPPELLNVFNASDGYTFTDKVDTPIEITCTAPHVYGSEDYNRYVAYNWCVNGDFRSLKNSSGNTDFSTNGAVFDGWNLLKSSSADNVVVSVEDGFVNYSVNNCSNYNRLYYPLSIDYEVGMVYTLSAVVRVNNFVGDNCVILRMGNGNAPLSGEAGSSTYIPYNLDCRIVSTTVRVTSKNFEDARIEFLVSPNTTCDIDILAVKLERQSLQSLAFEGYDRKIHFYSDVYCPPAPIIGIDDDRYTLSTRLSFARNSHDKIFYDVEVEKWKVYRYVDDCSYDLPASDQEIMNKTLSETAKFVGAKLLSLDADSVASMLYDGVNTIDVSVPAIVTISYYHTGTWFEYVYFMMGKLYERIGQVDGAVVNIENTVVDIVQDNDAFNIFYVEKTDGTTESVGDVTTDAAKFVGEFLSIFYRLVFEDAFSNADIMHDFEDVYTDNNVGVSVW